MPLVCLLQSFLDRWSGASRSQRWCSGLFQWGTILILRLMLSACLKENFQNLISSTFGANVDSGHCISLTSQLLKCTKGHIQVRSWWLSGCRMTCCWWSLQQCRLGSSPELFCLWISVFYSPVKTGEDRPWEHIRARTRSIGQQTLETNGQTGGREEVWNLTGAFSITSLSYLLITSAAVSQLKPTIDTSHPNTLKWSFKLAVFYSYLRNYGSYLF